MFEIDFKSRKTISEQILDNMKELIMTGILKEGEKLPSVREMAGMLTVNPNTVQKAYRILESQGYIYKTPGRGTFVSDVSSLAVDKKDLHEAKVQLQDAVNRLYFLGLDKNSVIEILKQTLRERSDWK